MGGAPAHLLDVSRLVSRVGRGVPTGIDRVEHAYLRHLVASAAPLWGLTRLAGGFALIGRDGLAALEARLSGRQPWGPPDWQARLRLRQSAARRRAESDLRRLAANLVPAGGLAAALAAALPADTLYLNTGHANLALPVMRALRAVAGLQIAVLVHDTIPLDHPQYCRPGTAASFDAKLAAVAVAADRVIYPSAAARAAAEPHLVARGRVPPGRVAHLGVEPAAADPAALPAALTRALDPGRPLFLAVGTIEPRKDHGLLLDLWQGLAADPPPGPPPQLVIAGARGWAAPALFARLDRLAAAGDGAVIEAAGLSDGAVAALCDRAAALLFPSRAEGFGLPPVEAAARGCPVIAADLPACREVLGEYPVYAPPGDLYCWRTTTCALLRSVADGRAVRPAPRPPPSWAAHFNAALATA